MAMEVDRRQQSQLSGLGYGAAMRYPAPQFTNPWVSAPAATQQLYPTSLSNSSLESSAAAAHPGRPTSISIPSYPLQVTASPLGAGISLPDGLFDAQNLVDPIQDMMNPSRGFAAAYPNSASSTSSAYAPTSATQYTMDYPNHSRSPFTYAQDTSRRSSHPSVPSHAYLVPPVDSVRQRQSSLVDPNNRLSSTSQRNSFSEALDASRGMLAMSQDITPRNIYGIQGSSRSSIDSYGFPTAHSTHSSISSASYPYYAGSNADGSVTDYSSASESVDNSRTLPRPSAMAGSNVPPAPQSMMGQFSSKVSSSSQKKHKCKICDKRFTRPSSLQTHMYSHTGEKPFACEVDGCGRHFSVVSNLRRHRKVHKGERGDHPSPEE